MTKRRTFLGNTESQIKKCYSFGQNTIVEAHNRNAESQEGKADLRNWRIRALKSFWIYWGTQKTTHRARAGCMFSKDRKLP